MMEGEVEGGGGGVEGRMEGGGREDGGEVGGRMDGCRYLESDNSLTVGIISEAGTLIVEGCESIF